MAEDKPKTITAELKTAMVCTNCQRSIDAGETVTTESLDEMNRGAVLCSDCTSQPDPKTLRNAPVIKPATTPPATVVIAPPHSTKKSGS